MLVYQLMLSELQAHNLQHFIYFGSLYRCFFMPSFMHLGKDLFYETGCLLLQNMPVQRVCVYKTRLGYLDIPKSWLFVGRHSLYESQPLVPRGAVGLMYAKAILSFVAFLREINIQKALRLQAVKWAVYSAVRCLGRNPFRSWSSS